MNLKTSTCANKVLNNQEQSSYASEDLWLNSQGSKFLFVQLQSSRVQKV